MRTREPRPCWARLNQTGSGVRLATVPPVASLPMIWGFHWNRLIAVGCRRCIRSIRAGYFADSLEQKALPGFVWESRTTHLFGQYPPKECPQPAPRALSPSASARTAARGEGAKGPPWRLGARCAEGRRALNIPHRNLTPREERRKGYRQHNRPREAYGGKYFDPKRRDHCQIRRVQLETAKKGDSRCV